MKFSTKIFSIYIFLYIFVIVAVGITVTSNSYDRLIQQEVNRSVSEEQNIYSNVLLYLMNSQQSSKEDVALASYGGSIVDLFSGSGSYLEVFDQQLQLIATNSPAIWNQEREELQVAANGQVSIILRHDEQGNYYLFVCSRLEMEEQALLLCLVKDITYIEQYRQDQYRFFVQIGFFGLLLVGAIIAVLSRLLIRPIQKLSTATQNIAEGNYQQRVDITSKDEVGHLARQFNLMADEIESKVQQLELETMRQQRFIDNLAHEFRTPLTSIIGYAELLQKMEYDKGLFDKSLGYIYGEGKRMLGLNKMLMDLTFYRESDVQLESGFVLPICREARETVAVRTAERGISVEIVGEDFELLMERDLLKSLLINLLDNAIKASTEGSKILIGTERREGANCLLVQDFGKGMAQEELERIKEPFYRVDKARSRQDGGVGLGVPICNQIVDRLGGRLDYESVLGQGTTVRMTFPQLAQTDEQCCAYDG